MYDNRFHIKMFNDIVDVSNYITINHLQEAQFSSLKFQNENYQKSDIFDRSLRH